MKRIFLSLTFLVSLTMSLCVSNVMASTSRVGDYVVITGNFQGGVLEIKGAYTNFTRNMMAQKTTTKLSGNVLSEEETFLQADDVLTPEEAALMVAMCPQIGGTHEYLDLAVGRTLTCRVQGAENLVFGKIPYIIEEQLLSSLRTIQNQLEYTSGNVWLGPFPIMGMARLELDGAYLEVTDYRWN